MTDPPTNQIVHGSCLEVMRSWPAESVNMVMTSPPYYGLRDYGIDEQIGLEPDYHDYIKKLVEIGREIKRILRRDGSWYLNMGDSYAGSWQDYGARAGGQRSKSSESFVRGDSIKTLPPTANVHGIPAKCQMMIPHRVALALVDDGWICRNTIIWYKPNSMPSSVKDRLTNKYEFIFHLVKGQKYFYDLDSIRMPHRSLNPSAKRINWEQQDNENFSHFSKGRDDRMYPNPKGKNPGDVLETGDFWSITTRGFPEAHFATYPEALCERPIKSSCPKGGIVLDPMCGSGTTCVVAKRLGRRFIGIDLNPDYCEMARKRLANVEWPLDASRGEA